MEELAGREIGAAPAFTVKAMAFSAVGAEDPFSGRYVAGRLRHRANRE
jgi:hypothetical protein